MKIAVLGGAGFVGTRLVARLIRSHQVTVVDIADRVVASASYENVSVTDLEALVRATAGCDAIVNLAAVHRDDVRPVSLYDEVNVNGAENVCRAARENAIDSIVFTSSVAVYGFAPVGTDENGKRDYFNDYGRTKAAAEDIYRSWANEATGRSLTILRPTVVFGEDNRGNVYNLLRQIASRWFVMIGDGRNRKSMAYVENVAAFAEHALSFGEGVHLYNYVDKPDLTMNELVSLADEALGRERSRRVHVPYWVGYLGGLVFDLIAIFTRKRFSVSSIRVKKFCSNTVFSADKLRETGFHPPVDMSEALGRTIRHEFTLSGEASHT